MYLNGAATGTISGITHLHPKAIQAGRAAVNTGFSVVAAGSAIRLIAALPAGARTPGHPEHRPGLSAGSPLQVMGYLTGEGPNYFEVAFCIRVHFIFLH